MKLEFTSGFIETTKSGLLEEFRKMEGFLMEADDPSWKAKAVLLAKPLVRWVQPAYLPTACPAATREPCFGVRPRPVILQLLSADWSHLGFSCFETWMAGLLLEDSFCGVRFPIFRHAHMVRKTRRIGAPTMCPRPSEAGCTMPVPHLSKGPFG